jgi:hypothetical protein
LGKWFQTKNFLWEFPGLIAAKLWWNGPWIDPFQIIVRRSRLSTKMADKLKIEKWGDEIKKKCSPLKLLNGSHHGRRAETRDTFLEENHPMTISSKFSSYWANGFRQKKFYGNFP